ncbi:MAG: serine/threonine-protein kinase [Desulfobacteraceae bacterium]|jgi:serine/threonine-protein kinase|nr:serine/threonine-protein kinase [Desulfobacteraceae bacterium]
MNEFSTQSFLTPGTVLSGTYQIIRLIGQGGMGAVYMAYDTRLDLKVAIKVISPELTETMDATQNNGLLNRFRSEARIAAKIDHPNVIRIFGFMQDNIDLEGRNIEIDYLVMELLAGRTLRDTMDVSGFEYESEIQDWITKFMIPILEGLEKVHGCGIIHRDIKPENFFMKENVVKLADFGLSMGFDLPSVTDSVADIFGTMTYMAPEQFYNFKLAREPADIFSIGRIIYEVVEGKLTDKIKPFKQVHLPNTETDYLKALNEIIMSATAENLGERIKSARELKDRLLQLHSCRLDGSSEIQAGKRNKWKSRLLVSCLIIVALGIGALMMKYSSIPKFSISSTENQTPEVNSIPVKKISHGTVSKGLKSALRAKDHSILHLIPPVEVELADENPLGISHISLDSFYVSENPITNQQYVTFLNANLARIDIVDSDVQLEGQLVLKLSEKIRGYKPIVFDGERFGIQYPMHSSCAVLLVTGYGADAYARHYGLRLMEANEWYAVMLEGNEQPTPRMQLPSPVINYKQDTHGLRAINQIAEWGKTGQTDFIILGQSPSDMIESKIILQKDPSKYYTDTSFRVAKDVMSK